MSLGNARSTNKLYDQPYYSRISFKNQDEKRAFGFTYRSGMIIIEIKSIEGNNNITDLESIFITPTKAKLLLSEISQFRKDIEDGSIVNAMNGYGINAGMGDVSSVFFIHTNENGNTVFTISKIDSNGAIVNSADFTCSTDYHYSIECSNYQDMSTMNKVFHNGVELDTLESALREFSNASTGAYAYATADMTRYDHKAILTKMDPIYDKLGIERKIYQKATQTTVSQNNYFNNRPNLGAANSTTASSDHKSYDEALDGLGLGDVDDEE